MLGALARALPAEIPAASGGQGCMVALALPDLEAGRRHVTVIEPMIGGGGARPGQDGIDGCDASLGFLKTTPAETLEAEVPAIVVRRFHLVADSGGPGRWRGGHAVRLDLQVSRPEGLVTARGMERLRFPPWGVPGAARRDGPRGAESRTRRGARAAKDRRAGACAGRRAEHPDAGRGRTRRSARAPGGARARRCGGGPRDAGARARRLRRRGDDRAVRRRRTEAATAAHTALRAERAARAAAPAEAFDFGAARDAHERRWPSDLQDAFIALLMALPLPYRAYVRRELYPRVTALAEREPVTADGLVRLWRELAAASGLPAALADTASAAAFDQPVARKEARA